jgi:hypothetical protein
VPSLQIEKKEADPALDSPAMTRKRDIKQFRQACKELSLLPTSGSIVDAHLAYPDVLHVEIKDLAGKLWRLATQDAEWSPADPNELVGRSIEDASTGELRCKLSGGILLDVRPAAHKSDEDPPNWELITPAGVVLEFGPGVRWQISGADAPVSRR